MTLCPIALAIGCRRCAIVRVCPVKTIIGDYKAPVAGRGKSARGKRSSRRN